MAYATRADVEMIYGAENTRKWADLDNEQNLDDIEVRVQWALDQAAARIDAQLSGGAYGLPFDEPYSLLLVEANARLAGVLLHDARGYTDEDEFKPHREAASRLIRSVRSGKLTLIGVEAAKSIPAAVTDYANEPDATIHLDII